MAQYGKPEYWGERYTRDPEPFDWYQRWAGLKEILQEYIQPNHSILNVGCGNSRLSEEMYLEGYNEIENIDISQVCIQAMKEKYNDKPGMNYNQMDCRELKFPDGAFHAVVDKGTIDSVLCGEGSTHNAQKTLSEISRVLKPGGVYIVISHGMPSYRLTYLQRQEFEWTVKIQQVQKPMMGMTASLAADDKDNVHYVYICTKGESKS